jgi:nitroreductase
MSQREHEVLTAAAQAALRAPSIFNTQPWQWRVDANSLELRADRDRQLTTVDPHGWFLVLSCGASLHHARVALAAAGWRVVVDRFPDHRDPDLLARIRLDGPAVASAEDLAMYAVITTRRTDRRPFGEQAVSDVEVQNLVAAARREGAQLYDIRPNQMPMLAVAVASAEAAQMNDTAYRNELLRWTNRPQWSSDGVPQATGVAHVARRIPVRDFVSTPSQGMTVKPGGDHGARYLIVYGPSDAPQDWLLAGEAVSAILLTAVGLGLGVAPISDVIEVEHPRTLVRGLLPRSGQPYLVVRCGHSVDATPIAEAPRRDATDAIRWPQP